MDDNEAIAVLTEVAKGVQGNIDGIESLVKIQAALAHVAVRLSPPEVEVPVDEVGQSGG